MKVKFNGEMSEFLTLIGGGPQGTLVGGLEYLAQSNDNADVVPPEDRYKYIDDLSVLQLVLFCGLLVDYNYNMLYILHEVFYQKPSQCVQVILYHQRHDIYTRKIAILQNI